MLLRCTMTENVNKTNKCVCVRAARIVNMLMQSRSTLFNGTTRRKCEWNTTSSLHKIFSLFRKPICTINVQTVTRHKLHTHTNENKNNDCCYIRKGKLCVQIFASRVDDSNMCSSVRLLCVCCTLCSNRMMVAQNATLPQPQIIR